MDRRDYYVEYYEVLDRVLSDYVNQLREKREHWLNIILKPGFNKKRYG